MAEKMMPANWNRPIVTLILFLTVAANATPLTLDQSDDDAVLMYVQFESSSEIPDACQEELTLPARVLSQNVTRDYLCGDEYFDKCHDVLDYIFRLEYTTDEQNFVNQMLEALTMAGSNFICGMSQDNIDKIMNSGGSLCLRNSATAINYCSYVSIVKFDTSQPLESICKTLDYAFDCNMKSIAGCNLYALNDLWHSYYRAVINQSPCDKYSKWGNIYPMYSGAAASKIDSSITIMVAVVSLYSFGFLQRIL